MAGGIPPSGGTPIDNAVFEYNDKGELTINGEVPLGLSLNEYRTAMNELFYRADYNRFQHGLASMGYPDGLYDYFRDTSKIASSTNLNIQTGADGNIGLSAGGTIGNQIGPVPTSASSSSSGGGYEIKPETDLPGLEVKIGSNTSGVTQIAITDADGNILTDKTGLSGAAGSTYSFSISLSKGTTYYVLADANGSSYTLTNESFSGYPYTGDYVAVTNGSTANVGDNPSGGSYARNLAGVTAKGYSTSGSVTSTTQDKGYSATAVTPTADYSLNGQNIDSLKVFDGAGNELASFTESEIGDTKSVSTSRTDYYWNANLSGDGSGTPKIQNVEIGLDDGS